MAVINPTTIFSAVSAVNDLLNNGGGVDTVAIFNDETLEQVFFEARPLKADVRETSQIMRHPVESGTMISDNHIINQIEINLLLFISAQDYNAIYTQIKQAFISGTLFLVQTRTGVYRKMVIANMPHTEDPDMYDAITMNLHMVEVIYVLPISVSSSNLPANYSPSAPANSNTVQAGLKYAQPASGATAATVQSILTGVGFKVLQRF